MNSTTYLIEFKSSPTAILLEKSVKESKKPDDTNDKGNQWSGRANVIDSAYLVPKLRNFHREDGSGKRDEG